MLCSFDSFRAGVQSAGSGTKVGARPLFLSPHEESSYDTTLQTDIEERSPPREPEVEVLLVEPVGGGLRVVIDHPEGVSLALCERVTQRSRTCASTTRSRSPRPASSAR